MYYKDGITYGNSNAIRNANKNVSLPAVLSDAFLAEIGYKVVVDGEKPTPSIMQYVVPTTIDMINGIPTQMYALQEMFSEYKDEDGVTHTKEEQEKKYLSLKQEEIREQYEHKIQEHLDAIAHSYGYDNILSACSYASVPNDFQKESQKFVLWRASVWSYGYAQLAIIKSGDRTLPTVEAFIKELPVYEG